LPIINKFLVELCHSRLYLKFNHKTYHREPKHTAGNTHSKQAADILAGIQRQSLRKSCHCTETVREDGGLGR